VDEARKVIRRLERIEALQQAEAPAAELLGEVRQLLAEGEAWLVAERSGAPGRNRGGDGDRAVAAAGALEDCRARLDERQEVVRETAQAAFI